VHPDGLHHVPRDAPFWRFPFLFELFQKSRQKLRMILMNENLLLSHYASSILTTCRLPTPTTLLD
jgi:hypothetical protein